ncbi:MAG: UbiA family prenyltransferase [Bacteroidia bacterium]
MFNKENFRKPAFSSIIRTLIFGNFFIATGGALLGFSTFALLKISFQSTDVFYLMLLFGSILFIYNFDRIYSADTDIFTIRHIWLRKNSQVLRTIMFASVPLMAAGAWFLNTEALIVLAVLAFISVAYSIPIVKAKTMRLKQIGLLKIFLIAFVWSTSTTIVPILNNDPEFINGEVFSLWSQHFLFIFALSLPFDIRDLHPDELAKVRTVPGRIGIRLTLLMALLMLILFAVLVVLQFGHEFFALALPQIIAAVYLAIIKWKPKRPEQYYTFWLDGGVVVLPVLVLLFSWLDKVF